MTHSELLGRNSVNMAFQSECSPAAPPSLLVFIILLRFAQREVEIVAIEGVLSLVNVTSD